MTYEIDGATLDDITANVPADTPIFMLNLLRFQPDGGADRFFNDYVPAFRSVMAAVGVNDVGPTWTGAVAGMVAAPEHEHWDTLLIVRYPSIGAFRTIVESEQYRAQAAQHRIGALTDWRLIAHTELPLP